MKKLFLIAALALMVGSVQAGTYLRISAGEATWDSPMANLHSTDTQPLFDSDEATVGAVAIGYDTWDNSRIELEYTDFGSAELAFTDNYQKCLWHWCKSYSDDYNTRFSAYATTGWVVYDLHLANLGTNPLTFNLRGGISQGNMEATVNGVTEKVSDVGIAFGAGLDLQVNDHVIVNASWEQHNFTFNSDFDYNPKLIKLGATFLF